MLQFQEASKEEQKTSGNKFFFSPECKLFFKNNDVSLYFSKTTNYKMNINVKKEDFDLDTMFSSERAPLITYTKKDGKKQIFKYSINGDHIFSYAPKLNTDLLSLNFYAGNLKENPTFNVVAAIHNKFSLMDKKVEVFPEVQFRIFSDRFTLPKNFGVTLISRINDVKGVDIYFNSMLKYKYANFNVICSKEDKFKVDLLCAPKNYSAKYTKFLENGAKFMMALSHTGKSNQMDCEFTNKNIISKFSLINLDKASIFLQANLSEKFSPNIWCGLDRNSFIYGIGASIELQ